MLRKSPEWVSWRIAKNAIVTIFAFCLFYFVYVWRLATLVPGFSKEEAAARLASSSFHKILDNPFYAPHKIIQYVLQQLDYHGPLPMRGVSVLFALVFLISLFLLLRLWFGKFIAVAGTLLFAFTPWIILLSRSATPDILFLSPILLLFAYAYLSRASKYVALYWFVFIFALALSLYTPGMVWFILAALILRFRQILRTILKVKGVYTVAGITILILLLLPLFYAFSQHLMLIKEFFAIPGNFSSPAKVGSLLVKSFSALFFQLNSHSDYAMGKFALLSIAQIALVVVGIVAIRKKAVNMLAGLLISLIISILLTAINNNLLFLIYGFIPVAILDAAGLRYLYKKWFEVFPLNPLARWFALTLIVAVLFVSMAYGARYALLAWPHNIETRNIYVVK
jgi:hypothetical protein